MLYDYSKNRKLSKYFHNTQMQVQQELKGYTNRRTQVVLDGPWERVRQQLSTLGIDIAMAVRAGQLQGAKEFKKKIERNIENGGASFGFPALSTKTLSLKGARGQSSTMFNATKTYSRSIIIKDNGNVIRVGIKPHARNTMPGSNLTVGEYATILEYGSSRGIPARPLWKRTMKDFGGAKKIRSYMKIALATALAKKGFR